MKTSKITEIVRTNEWESKYGPMYSITLKMENWETISLNKKKSDAFKVWWTISYEELEPWKKWKEVIEKKPNENNNYNNPKS